MEQIGLLRAYSSEESRRYLDEMLEAITGKKAVGSEELRSPAEDPERASAEAEETDGRDDEAEQTETEVEEDELEPTKIPGSASSEIESIANTALAQDSQAAAESSLGDAPSLKDLILKLAQAQAVGREERSSPSTQNQDETSERLKLRKFGKILTELKAKSQGSGDGSVAEQQAERVAAEPASGKAASTAAEPVLSPDAELFSVILTTKNRVNGNYVTRPGKLFAPRQLGGGVLDRRDSTSAREEPIQDDAQPPQEDPGP